MKTALQIVMLLVIIGLGYCVYESVSAPIHNEEQYNKRKEAVVKRLKLIRDAQVAYKTIYNKYTGSFDTLIDFVKNGQLKVPIMQGELSDSAREAGITEKEAVKLGIIKRDTIYVAAKDSVCKNFNPDSLRFVPFVGDQFFLGATILTTSSGLQVPVFEANVTNRVFLRGLDNQDRINRDKEAEQLERFPGLKVGSLVEANNNAGNWE